MQISLEQLLAEFEDLIRTMPPKGKQHWQGPEVDEWFGRAQALVGLWAPVKSPSFETSIRVILINSDFSHMEGFRSMLRTLNEARFDLRMKTAGHLSVVVDAGKVFEYFDETRKLIEGATTDILFVDPYLDAEFVSTYLPHVKPGVTVRLLTQKKLEVLTSAVVKYRQQSGLTIEVRSGPELHDRYIFIDQSACYQSGASFKDGAKKAPAMINQILDAFPAISATYEALWAAGTRV